jgi:hypothetical protein
MPSLPMMSMRRRTLASSAVRAVALLLLASVLHAQKTPRDLRVEVRDNAKRPVADAQVLFFLTGDSARTDSSGIALATIEADSAINITVKKIGFAQRNARFKIGTAPAFTVRVTLGEDGQLLREIEVRDEYPGEPWREAFERRKKRGGGVYRDVSYFPGGYPSSITAWFEGIPAVSIGGGSGTDMIFRRCRSPGVWIDGQHATSLGNGYRAALRTVPALDIAAIELYQIHPPAPYTAQNEDCAVLIWTRHQ